jgi:hypothetical protein
MFIELINFDLKLGLFIILKRLILQFYVDTIQFEHPVRII